MTEQGLIERIARLLCIRDGSDPDASNGPGFGPHWWGYQTLASDIVDVSQLDVLRPTNQFRWVTPSHATTRPPRLQQFYQGVGAAARWIDVPLVVSDEEPTR